MALRTRGKIRAPRGLSKDDSIDFESTWAILSSSLQEIHNRNPSRLSFEELYRHSYKLVLKKQGEKLYEKVKGFEQLWLSNTVRRHIAALIGPSLLLGGDMVDAMAQAEERRAAGERFLLGLRSAWEDHQLCMSMITDVLMYMDRVICADHRYPSIYIASMCLFRDFVLRATLAAEVEVTIGQVLESTVLFMIRLERGGEIIDRPLIRHCMYMLEGLYETAAEEETSKLYLTTFEPAFLEASRLFYRAEGQRLLATTDAATFCRLASNRLAEEEERCRGTLSSVTEPKIKDVIDEELIRRNIADVVQLEGSGVRYMLDNDKLEDLNNVYKLITRVDPKKAELTKAMQQRVVELGSEINAAAKAFTQVPPPPAKDEAKASGAPQAKPKGAEEKAVNQQTAAAIQWVDDILALKTKYDHIWTVAFESDQGLQTSLTASFGDFINENARSSEYLSLFFDENLKKGIKGKTEDEVDALLENGITLLRYIRSKDLFETYYKKHLSRRLLIKRSVSMEAERQMISKMKMEVGNAFTQRLEAMFKDMAISDDLTTNYRNTVLKRGDPDPKRIDLEISVLTSTMWPTDTTSNTTPSGEHVLLPCVFPREIEAVQQSFEKFYLAQHTGRKLTWQPNMGTADIRATFNRPNGKTTRHDLNVSTYAMVVLLLFNDLPPGESLSFEDIQAQTRIPANDLIRNLQSLAVAPKTRVLRKEPMSKDVKPDDQFFFNDEFKSMYTRIKIGVVANSGNKVENQKERKETEKRMNEERGGTIEAAIVRIMKQRKKLAHSQLITEVITQLASRFSPDVTMVKKRIESLIDREYIERLADTDPPAYGYIA